MHACMNSILIYSDSTSDTEYKSKGTFKSVRKAVDLAREAAEEKDPDKLSGYLAMTDSLVGYITSADACTESEQEKLDKVYYSHTMKNYVIIPC